MNAITTTHARQAGPVLTPQTFDQLVQFAELAANSDMVPKDYRGKPANIMLACQMGHELGLQPMQALTSIAVINGRPGLWGDGLIGVCRQSPLCQDIAERIEGEGDNRAAVCIATRRGSTPSTSRFSVADAKRAGLWGKAGPWAQYPDRMLQNRARSFALRDAFPDLLRGLKTVEELRDTPPDAFRGTTLDAEPPAQRSPNQPPVSESAPPATTEPKRTWRQLIDETAGMLTACDTVEAVLAVGKLPQVDIALTKASVQVQTEIKNLLADAYERVQALADDAAEAEEPFPGDTPLEHEAAAPA